MASTLAQNLTTPTPNLRRGACPGLSAPMPTGDGLLVRLLPAGTIPLDTFRKLCAAARRHGNGIIEITARGSIQIRGLNAASAPRFADAIAALNTAAADGIPVLSNALAGLDPQELLDAGTLAAELRRALTKTSLSARLAPKVSVVIDGGGTPGLDGLAADVRLCADTTNSGVALRVSVGGDRTSAAELGAVAPSGGAETAVRLLEVIAQSGRAARARDIIAANGTAALRAAIVDCLIDDPPPPKLHKSTEAIGTYRLRDRTLACGIGLAFGHADAVALERLADAARSSGAVGLRPAPGRALMMIGLMQAAAPSFAATAENLGFIVRANDPRRHVVACAGAPICSSAHIAARALAPRIAEMAAPQLGAAFEIHISGCVKGCAHAKATALTVVGSPDGCALIADGCARDIPFATVGIDELPAVIERYARAKKREASHV
jgi:precorrin-3B synthase